MTQNVITNLVFEGGGIKGIAFVGAMRYLEENDILSNIKNIIGSSAGSLVASFLTIGYSADELEKILKDTDYCIFRDNTIGLIRNCIRIMKNYGFYKGDKYLEWLGERIKDKTGNSDITFKQIYDTYGINLVITGTNLNKAQVIYFNHENYPDMPIRLAIRISCSIPLVFKCVKYEDDIYVDGGVLDNYPIWYFDNYEETLGFKLVNPDEKQDDLIYHNNLKINNIIDYCNSVLNAMLNQIDRLHVKNDYWERTITINTFNISATDFKINLEQKDQLINEGYLSTKNFFHPPSID